MRKKKTYYILALILINLFISICSYAMVQQKNKQIKELKNTPTIIIERDISPIPYDDLGEFTLTWYNPTGNRTKTQTIPKQAFTVAVDPKVIPLGSIIYIENWGVFVACDTGSKVVGKKVDIFINSVQQAKNNGVKKARVYLIKGVK